MIAQLPGKTARPPAMIAQLPAIIAQIPGETAQIPGETAQLPGETAQLPGETPQLPGETARLQRRNLTTHQPQPQCIISAFLQILIFKKEGCNDAKVDIIPIPNYLHNHNQSNNE
ncbi:hypothetical protein ACFOUV_14310 [Oceanobacillus longus]|uniref:Uncharacterized protein n=1 Tax=Oceanobacillus longus TaxID=930120 RepID=A0ABV8GYM5_9BACI